MLRQVVAMERSRYIVVTDVDGTLTIDRDTYIIEPSVIDAIKKIRRNGHIVILASGNSIPVLAGLSRYIGANMSCIAENGCAIFHEGIIEYISPECKELEEIENEVASRLKEDLKPSWQNIYRRCDKSFNRKSNRSWKSLLEEVKKILFQYGARDYRVVSTSYAIHITHKACSKSAALERLIHKYFSSTWGDVIAIGDSITDREMILKAKIGCAVSNSDPELLSVAKCVSTKPSGRGFVEIIENLILAE